MADRNEFLGRVQQQLGAWADWMRQLDDQASSTAAQVRADAKVAYTQRSEKVRELIRQGRAQWERVSAATDDAWQGIAAGAERSWSALQDAAAGLAMQTLPVATELQPAASAVPKAPRKAHARSAGKTKPAKKKPAKKKPAKKKVARKAAARKSAKKAGKKSARKSARKSAGARNKAVKRSRAARKPTRKK